MAKDNRAINSTVRVQIPIENGKGNQSVSFAPGQEDELAAVLSEADGQRLIKRGVLSGDWEFAGKKAQAVKSPEAEALQKSESKYNSLAQKLAETQDALNEALSQIEQLSHENEKLKADKNKPAKDAK